MTRIHVHRQFLSKYAHEAVAISIIILIKIGMYIVKQKTSKEIKGIEARLQRTVWNTYIILLYYYESWFIDPKGMMEATPRGINTKTAFSSLKFYSKMNLLHVL